MTKPALAICLARRSSNQSDCEKTSISVSGVRSLDEDYEKQLMKEVEVWGAATVVLDRRWYKGTT